MPLNKVYKLLKNSFLSGPVVDKNGYPYYVNPICDGIPKVDPDVLEEAVDGLMDVCKFDCDLILAPEAMGIHLATALSLRTRIPFAVIRKRSYGLPGELVVNRSTGYSSGKLYINGVKAGDRVSIVDDTISTGGTLKSIVAVLSKHDVEISEIGVVYNKSKNLSDILPDVNVKTLLNVRIEDGKPYLEY